MARVFQQTVKAFSADEETPIQSPMRKTNPRPPLGWGHVCCAQKDSLAALLAPRPSRFVPVIPLKLPVADHIFIDREVART